MISDADIVAALEQHIPSESITAFAKAMYDLGRQHQRESDAALCLSTYPAYDGSPLPCCVTKIDCAEAILANTGDPKCQNQK